jgi:2,4-dienoyl-CoA reductase (NADPH2)
MSTLYPHLFSPLQLGTVQIKNRLVMGSMHTGLEDDNQGLEKLTRFYEERALGGVGLIVTGGFAPNRTGWLVPFSGKLTSTSEVQHHRHMTERVHAAGAKVLLQILHAGRYSYHPLAVAPSDLKSPISKFKPWAMSERRILSTIEDFSRCAELAEKAGYDGVEIMGSEGYLINQFVAPKTNLRKDQWGGSFENRIRFPLQIVRELRKRVSGKFIIMFRISMVDLVENGSTIEETLRFAQQLEKAGVTVFNTGIGWHEARVPTIATSVPRGAFAWVARKLKESVRIPVVAVNRINTPELAERLLAEGYCDLVSMARPLLADAEFANKAFGNRAAEINTCIGCNQGCLDLIFQNQRATCLVNPMACYETEMVLQKTSAPKRIAVVGAGPAGLAAAITAAKRGHQVVLFEASSEIGGQFNLAKRIPGKEEFFETLRYFKTQIEICKIELRLNSRVSAADLSAGFEEVMVATGVTPRELKFPGFDRPQVVSYLDVLTGRVRVGDRVAIIGAGGIGFDVAEFLLVSEFRSVSPEPGDGVISHFLERWGVSQDPKIRGSLQPKKIAPPTRKIYLMQRKAGKLGAGLGKTTGWIHRTELADAGVEMLSQVAYQSFDEKGLHILEKGVSRVLEVDHVVICAGQEPRNQLATELKAIRQNVHVIGGAFEALELDAKKAILQGTKVALQI